MTNIENITTKDSAEFALLESYDARIEDLENMIQKVKAEKELVMLAIIHNKTWYSISEILMK